MELTGKGDRHWQEFSSVTDIYDFITNDKYIQAESNNRSGANPPGSKNPSPSGSHKRFQETMRLMREGWPEGRERIEEFVVEVEKRVMGYIPVKEIAYDVAPGEWFDVGRYLSGEPETYGYMQDTDYFEKRKGGKIIHVVVNVDVTWMPFQRGAAGVAIIDALERSGYRVVADAIANTVANRRLLETRIRIKNSDEVIQLDKLAFLYAHEAILGQVLFAAWERLPPPIRKLYRFEQYYGSVGHVPKEDQGDIYVPREAGHYGDIQGVADYVLNVLKQNGIALREEPA